MTLEAARNAKTAKSLETLTRVNGGKLVMTRRALIERCVSRGYRVAIRKNGERVLMSNDGSWFDSKTITKIGIDYAETLYKK
jgi:hypothetical protein